ncbi:hypothetical protein [uncultured Paraglaciecola sp.]|uniref:hypothetical protein n=1 Tax=uncultured Paraglaciecola sp. TaxID=1765024 RepID=UPI00259485F7|nr:hypothetical protein [uncultured Paraglaciecola sp.]
MQLRKILSGYWAILLIIVISGCQSTNVEVPTPKIELKPLELNASTLFTFNTQLETALNNTDLVFFENQISTSLITEKLTKRAPQLFFTSKQVHKTASQFKNKIIESVTLFTEEFNWEYLYSETFSQGQVASYYRLETSEGYNYFTIWLNPNTFQIFDFHPVSYELSGLNFLISFTSLMSENSAGDNKQLVDDLLVAVQSQDIREIVKIYERSEDTISPKGALDDFVLRSIGQFATNENYTQLIESIIGNFEKRGKTSLMFEGHYFQNKNFKAAINAVNSIQPFALMDSKMQSELAILYGYDNNHTLAAKHARAAILSNPLDEEAYFVLLQVALFSEDHDLATEVIDVLIAKFDYIIDSELISSLENHQAFLKSDIFATWSNEHNQT